VAPPRPAADRGGRFFGRDPGYCARAAIAWFVRFVERLLGGRRAIQPVVAGRSPGHGAAANGVRLAVSRRSGVAAREALKKRGLRDTFSEVDFSIKVDPLGAPLLIPALGALGTLPPGTLTRRPRQMRALAYNGARCVGRTAALREDPCFAKGTTMTLQEILKTKGTTVYTIPPETTLLEVMRKLVEHNIGSLVVCDRHPTEGECFVGIITERDILHLCASGDGIVPQKRVSEVMTTDLITASPSDSVEHTMGLMTAKRIRHLPVVSQGRLVGLVSIGDVVKAQHDRLAMENQFMKDYIQSS